MGIGNLSYEECRKKRMEENKKRLEDLNLAHLSRSLSHLPPNSNTPMKKTKPRTVEKLLIPVRRSPRKTNNPAPVYAEFNVSRRLDLPRRSYGVSRARDLSDRVYASEETRASTLDKAEQFVSELQSDFPTLVRGMLPSHVSGGFWLGLPSGFCRKHMPKQDGVVTLVDEEGDEFQVVYLARKWGLSGGWKGFAVEHQLVDGDTVVFQLTSHSVMKVYIIRANSLEEEEEADKN
ncbi:hypothetical protein V2J09_007157 [Rumex salicifolius]